MLKKIKSFTERLKVLNSEALLTCWGSRFRFVLQLRIQGLQVCDIDLTGMLIIKSGILLIHDKTFLSLEWGLSVKDIPKGNPETVEVLCLGE